MKERFIMKKVSKIPVFKNENEEREFWANNDSSELLNWDLAGETVFPKLKPTTKTISLRLPEYMLAEIPSMANKRDVPYQSLIKIFLKEKIDQEILSAK